MPNALLTINAGSSSIKFGLYEQGRCCQKPLAHGGIEDIGIAPRFFALGSDGAVLGEYRWPATAKLDHEQLLKPLLAWVTSHLGDETLIAVGHRVVHGGREFIHPVLVDAAILSKLQALVPLAPLHQPHNIAAIQAMGALLPELPQVACFDTSFHHGMLPVAARMALPRRYEAQGMRRYGFHGLSYEYILGQLTELSPALARGRVIVAHLGNGASLCAIRDGRSTDTTMGFTALDGLVMGTRCGSLDPGAVLYLQQAQGLSVGEVEHLLYHESGLLGISGISSDMRTLLASSDRHARDAVDLFVFHVVREIGALTASMGGMDALVFSAGIGEHSAPVRAAVCEKLAWLGVEYDVEANASHNVLISTQRSQKHVFVIPTDEEAMLAAHTAEVLRYASPRAETV
ncbi:MAG TPA: acetate/propionate family kinase [Dyella sp.]|uniref:acetate/propionate family kinase n=1 Tax=Dyella sp. TaxID=1869338 RepID=UPI002C1564F9|nr:acetate/propionate family kinase [Dyella sp.]HTV84649.1 acetate/propionate family kinase [Dyella sp.]